MSAKNSIEVVINGQVLTIEGYESEAYLQKVAGYINSKIAEFKKDESFRKQKSDFQKVLIDINIADDYFKAKKQADMLEKDLEEKETSLYDIKHDLIKANAEIENLRSELEKQNEKLIECQKDIVRYQTELKNK